MNPPITFRRLAPVEFDSAYSIVCEATNWLLGKGIQQWLKPYPLAPYRERHEKGQNYGLFIEDELAVVASLFASKPIYWEEFYRNPTLYGWQPWLRVPGSKARIWAG